jgi:hypothetical protein
VICFFDVTELVCLSGFFSLWRNKKFVHMHIYPVSIPPVLW